MGEYRSRDIPERATMSVANGWRREGGVAAVEMALMAPILILLFMGVVETAWLLNQTLDVRQASREASRLASLDHGSSGTIAADVCAAMDNDDDTTITFVGSSGTIGDDVDVTVAKQASHLTSFLDWVFPPTMILQHTATFALEISPPTWTDGVVSCP